ncbi:MAG TPA: DNA adenine methylase [Bacteroidales bacterium]|nr:DNA adenine methylase [Bacteroidales bacterium]HSA43611.1 DNA adenine methylase [Bacteroidales bacterium]
MDKNLTTPISYYGGKQKMLRHILPLIPEHHLYDEPFCGGAAVYWAKKPAKVEVINDLNEELINFYIVVKTQYQAIKELVKSTLHSRKMHAQAWAIYSDPKPHDQVKRAWAVWVLATQGFSSQLSNSWGYDRKKGSMAIKVRNKKIQFTEDLALRLEYTQVECRDAISVIRTFDTPGSFHYLDPPYPNTDQAHYAGYTVDDLEQLLKTLTQVKGKFLLSNYPQAVIDEYCKEYGWYQRCFKMPVAASKKAVRPTKIEVLTANYPI